MALQGMSHADAQKTNSSMNLRPYQIEILNAVRKSWETFRKTLVVSPQGSGKTVVFSHIAAETAKAGGHTLILVDQEELVWQAIDKLKKATGLIGRAEKAEHSASLKDSVVVATVQTMVRRLGDWPADHFRVVIADEADKSLSPMWQRVLTHFDGTAKVCGFTATPWRSDAKQMGDYYEDIAIEIKLLDLIRQGFICPIKIKMLPIQIDLSSVHLRNGDFDTDELDRVITPYLEAVARGIMEHASFRKVLVFVPLIKTSEKFISVCRSIGMAAEHIDGESEDRAEKLKRFAAGEFDVMSNSALLTRGYDDPTIDCVVMLRPTKSHALYNQALGRGTRIHPTKEDLLILDFLYQSEKHDLCRPAHLICKNPEEADAITELAVEKSKGCDESESMDLQDLMSETQVKREEGLKAKLEAHKNRKAKFIDASDYAIQQGEFDVAEFQPTMKWESAAITEKQARVLERAKIDVETVRGKGHASKLIDLIFRNQKLQLATPAQRMMMRRMNYQNWETATQAEARQFFAQLRNAKAA